MFMNTQGKGFHMKFDNGWAVSVQWGPGTYSDNHDMDFDEHYKKKMGESMLQSEDAEVAVFKPNGDWGTQEVWSLMFGKELCDDVVGWMRAEEVAEVLHFVKNMAKEDLS